jgi:hypothetical protein
MLKLPVDASVQLTSFDDLGARFVTKLKTAASSTRFNGVPTGATGIEQDIVTLWEKLGKG